MVPLNKVAGLGLSLIFASLAPAAPTPAEALGEADAICRGDNGALYQKLGQITARAHCLAPVCAGVVEEKPIGGTGGIGKGADERLLSRRIYQFISNNEPSQIRIAAQFHAGVFGKPFVQLQLAFVFRSAWK